MLKFQRINGFNLFYINKR